MTVKAQLFITCLAEQFFSPMGSSRDNQALQALLFLPKAITINEGDTVPWAIGAADHNIYFPAGQKPPLPDAGR